ncbi:MAG: hypothetical protein U0271_23180 [Polyangiaceae bacterium]
MWVELHDEAERLVEADALLASGDPRGELVALQCELARLGDGPIRAFADWFTARAAAPELRAREAALLRKHRKSWLESARRHALSDRHVWLFRGAVDRVGWDAYSRFPSGLAELVEDVPTLRALDLATLPRSGSLDSIHAFCKSPALAAIEDLNVGALGRAAVLPIFESERMTRLHRLAWSAEGEPNEMRTALVSGSLTPRLRGLVLTWFSGLEGAIATLVERARGLREVQLRRIDLALEDLASLATLGSLEVLGLRNIAGPSRAAIDEALARVPAVRALDLSENGLRDVHLAALDPRSLSRVETLVLARNPLEKLGPLAKAPLPALRLALDRELPPHRRSGRRAPRERVVASAALARSQEQSAQRISVEAAARGCAADARARSRRQPVSWLSPRSSA